MVHVSFDGLAAFVCVIGGSASLYNTLPSHVPSDWVIARKRGLRGLLQVILTLGVLSRLIYGVASLWYPLDRGGSIAAPAGSIGAWASTIAFNFYVAAFLLLPLWAMWYLLAKGLRTAAPDGPPHGQTSDL